MASRPLFHVIAAAVSTLSAVGLVACTVVSGTSELQGGQCRKCVDASADGAADAAPDAAARPPLACGAASCDTRNTWCCVATNASACADPCPSATAALGCRLPSDCPTSQKCCAFRSTFSGDPELRFFSDCLPACNVATDEVVCDPRLGSACTGGAPCVPSEVPAVSVCR